MKRNLPGEVICFEALEPRLLLSGTWSAGAESAVSKTATALDNGFKQATVVVATQTNQTGATSGTFDLLRAAQAMNLAGGADTHAAPTSDSTAAPAVSSAPTDAAESSDAASPDETRSEQADHPSDHELVIVNDNVADYQQLIADLKGGDGDRTIDVAVLAADRDGIQQVSEILARYSDLSAVHFIAHGADGKIDIGGTCLNNGSLQQYQDAIADWGKALNENGDMLFYGCSIASGSAGQSLLTHIAGLTGADVAASDDPTGSAQLGGDWNLEFHSGTIETQTPFDAGAQDGWEHLMATPDSLQATATANGGLQLNNDGGNDAYMLADDGGAVLGGLTQMTYEMQFSASHPMTENTLVSYATSGNADEFRIFIGDTGNLTVSASGSSITSNATDYNTALEDGHAHSLAVTWDSSTGAWQIYVDGASVDSGTNASWQGASIGTGGDLVFGQDQNSMDGGYDPSQRFVGTLYDVRIFNTVRDATQIADNCQSILPYDQAGMIADWTFSNLSTGTLNNLSANGIVTEKVSGNNLTEQHATAGSYTWTGSTPELTFSVDENAADGTVVGTVAGSDAERDAQIASLLGADPNLIYSSVTQKFYKFIDTSADSSFYWVDANTNAPNGLLGGVPGQLVTIRSAAENKIVWNLAQPVGNIYIGASDQTMEGDWYWQSGGADADQFWHQTNPTDSTTGSDVNHSYQHWGSNQPNDSTTYYPEGEDAGGLDTGSGQWYDTPTDQGKYNYMVEWNADAVLDTTDALTYSIQSQTAPGAFTIDANSGKITVADGSLLDHQANPTQTVTVRVTDADSNTYDQAFTISLNNNAAPVITSSAMVNVLENQTAVTTGTATDADGDTPTFSITGSAADNSSFSINSTSGELTFNSAPDYENPGDANLDNVYEVEVTADDGNGGTDVQTISVTVTDEVELPTVNVPTGSTIAEDAGPLVFSTANGNRIWIGNISASDPAEVELSVPTGVLTLSGTTGLTFSLGDGTGDSAMSFSGTAADINAALDGLSFQPDADYNGNPQIAITAANERLSTVGHYSFEAAPGDDSSPSGSHDATVNGGASVVTDPTRGNVLQFDGVDDNLQITGHLGVESTNAVTIAGWVNLAGFDTNGADIFSMGNDVRVRLTHVAGHDSFSVGYYNGSSFIGTGAWLPSAYADLAAHGWVHLAYTVEHRDDGRTYNSFYVDGVSVGGGDISDSGIHFDHGPDTYIGTHGDGGAGYDFQGRMDEVCIFDRALSQDEITALVGERTTAHVDVEVTAVNDRPVLGGVANLSSIDEDDVSNSGTLVSSLFTSTDVDSGAVSGLAVNSVDNTNGTWEFSTDGGSNWSAFGSPNDNNVRLLAADASTYVRFVPNADFNGGGAAISYRVWDQTVGTAGGTIDLFANWSSNAFSLSGGVASITVNPVNDAPVLTPALPTLTTITEDDTGNAGQTVASFVGTSISDVDSGAVEGIAITGLNNGNGGWEYSTNGGTNWNAVGAVADGSALLLRSTDLVRFVPDGQNATTGSITYRAWDQTSGSPGTMIDASTNGGTTAFSTATDTAGITVTAINDAPVLTGDLSATVDEGGQYYLTGADLGYTDPDDVDAGVTFTVSNITNGNGIFVDGVGITTSFTGADLTAGKVRFVHDGSETTTASFDVNVEDGDEDGSTPVDSTFNFTVNPVNDYPSITASFDLASINEDDVSNSGALVSSLISTSDPDSGAVSGMAVWSVNNTNGNWEFSTDGGNNWIAFGSPWTNNVRLLAADAATYVRFVPNANFNGTVSPGLRFMAWDQTIGTAGGTIDMAANFSSNAFSFGAGSSDITVNPVNDAPQATNLNVAETYIEDTALDLTDIVVSDVDSANVTVTLTLSDVAAGSLSTGTSNAVTATFVGGVWTASGAIADVNILLAGVNFTPAASYNSNFTIATSVDDGVAPAVTGSKAMTGTAINDAPQATNLNAAETYTEDTSLGLTDIVVSDVDNANVTVTLTLSDTAAGTLSTGTSGAVTSTFAGGVWTASGAIADVNTLLAGVAFTPAANYNSNFTITTSVDDGVAPAVTGSKAMTGTAVNDPSVLAADSQTIDEDATATGNVLSNDSDVDDTLTVATFTVNGDVTVYNGGDAATIAGVGTVRIQTDGSYTFTPDASWNGEMPQVTYTTNTGSSSTLDIHVNPGGGSSGTGSGTGSDKGDDNDDKDEDKDDNTDDDKDNNTDDDKKDDQKNRERGSLNLWHGGSKSGLDGTDHYGPTFSMDRSDSIIPEDEGSPTDMAAELRNLMASQANQKVAGGAPDVGGFLSPEALVQTLDRIQQELDLRALASKAVQGNMIVGVATGLTVSVFAGYVIWAFRGTTLLFSALSAMPMWRCFDPLPVLLGRDKKRPEEEEEMTPEVEDAEDNISDLLGIEQMDSSRQVVIPEETDLI